VLDMTPVKAALTLDLAEFVAWRRDIHAHPETGFEEERTAARVADLLRSFGLEVTTGIARTGVVGTLTGTLSGPGADKAVGLRADLDALFVEECNQFAHRSVHTGRMHACGHDGHTVMLLAAARYLSRNRAFAGTVHFIFQPAEEGLGGGLEMIRDGLFERFPVEAVFGLHNHPGQPVGAFNIRSGPMMAASDTWEVTFAGSGGHGGFGPHLATDPTMPLAHFILAVQGIIGRNVPAIETAVLSVGHISGGSSGSPNIIPAEVMVSGTARSYSHAVRDLLEQRLNETASSIASAYGCAAKVRYNRRYPPLINHTPEVVLAATAARLVSDETMVNDHMEPITSAEDFAFMLMERPGAFMMLGNGVEPDGSFINVHSPDYDFNDDIIVTGAAYWVALAQVALEHYAT
jgi:hippurate hydrolase